MKKSFAILAFLIFSVLLSITGCSDLPTKSQAENDALTIAKNDAGSEKYFEVENLTRDNGWQEEQDYKIKFNYFLVAKSSYQEIFLEKLKGYTDSARKMTAEEKEKMMFPMTMASMVFGLQEMIGKENPSTKAINIAKNNSTILNYINANMDYYRKNEKHLDLILGMVYSELNELGFNEEMAKGHKIPREVTMTYKKTEKGWIKKD